MNKIYGDYILEKNQKFFYCYLYRATLVDVSKKFCFAPLQSNPIATKSPLYSFIMSLKSAYVMKSLLDNPTFYGNQV